MSRTWAIILAGGDGTRLRDHVVARYGYARPKQFCDFDGRGTLLDRTIRRALYTVPEQRVIVVSTRKWSAEMQEALAPYPLVRRVTQPRNLETTPAILSALLGIGCIDPQDTVLVLPSDHHLADDGACVSALHGAVDAAESNPGEMIVVGAAPVAPEDGYGWLLPHGTPAQGAKPVVSAIGSFSPGPDRAEALRLFRSGALLNTSIMAGRALALADLFVRCTPGWWRAMSAAAHDPECLDAAYSVLPASEFLRDVFERAIDRFRVMSVEGLRWTHIGTPDRLEHALGRERVFAGEHVAWGPPRRAVDDAGTFPAHSHTHAPRHP